MPMHSKRIFLKVALLLLALALSAGSSWSAPSKIFPQNGKDLYDVLYSLKSGTPVDLAYAVLGKPDIAEGNVLTWFSNETNEVFTIVSKDTIEASSYFKYSDSRATVKDTYDYLRSSVVSILGKPSHELSDFTIWFPDALELILLKDESSKEGLFVGILLKAPFVVID